MHYIFSFFSFFPILSLNVFIIVIICFIYLLENNITNSPYTKNRILMKTVVKISYRREFTCFMGVDINLPFLWKIKVENNKIFDKTTLRLGIYLILTPIILTLIYIAISIFIFPFQIIMIILTIQGINFVPIIICGVYLINKNKNIERNYDWVFDIIKEFKKELREWLKESGKINI